MLDETWIRRMKIDRDIIEAVRAVQLSAGEYQTLRRVLNQCPASFCEMVRSRPNYRKLFLSLYLHLAQEAAIEYGKRGISNAIYLATMQDILLWTQDCRHKYGETGIEEGEWLWRHVTLKLFRLGRLQYEVRETQGELELHIPGEQALLLEDCIKSMAMAEDFFGGQLHILCHSWLLNPELSHFLDRQSNILKFQSLFHVYELDGTSRQAEEKIFGRVLENPSEYPEKTRLQKAVKSWLIHGGNCGSAYGEIKW